jgi:hypothetical protein
LGETVFPKPDRSDYTPTRHRTPEDPSFDLGWNEGLFSDGRPYRAECWVEEGMTCLTFFFSTHGLETYSNAQFAELLEREGLVSILDRKARPFAMPVSDASGNDMWSLTIVVGIEEDTYIEDNIPLRSYWSPPTSE